MPHRSCNHDNQSSYNGVAAQCFVIGPMYAVQVGHICLIVCRNEYCSIVFYISAQAYFAFLCNQRS